MVRQNLTGIVVSAGKMAKTIKVHAKQQTVHPVVQKIISRGKNYLVHDEGSVCKAGDVVRIEACRPVSARKRFAVAEILCRAEITKELHIEAHKASLERDAIITSKAFRR